MSLRGLINKVEGSIEDTAQKKGISLLESFMDVSYLALVDISASMSESSGSGEGSRWRAMVSALTRLQRDYPGKWAVVQFNSKVTFQASGIPDEPSMFTDLAGALEFIHQLDGMCQMFVISDGEPDDKQSALNIASRFTSKLNVIAVGDAAGSEFMKKLADITGGVNVNLKNISEKMLTEGIKLLMEKN